MTLEELKPDVIADLTKTFGQAEAEARFQAIMQLYALLEYNEITDPSRTIVFKAHIVLLAGIQNKTLASRVMTAHG